MGRICEVSQCPNGHHPSPQQQKVQGEAVDVLFMLALRHLLALKCLIRANSLVSRSEGCTGDGGRDPSFKAAWLANFA